MKITFVLPHGGLAGGVRVVAVYAAALAERGHKVCVVTGPFPKLSLRERARRLVREGTLRTEHERGCHLDSLPAFVERRHVRRTTPIAATDLPDADVVIATWWETAPGIARLPAAKGAKAYFIQHDETVFYPDLPAKQAEVVATLKLPMHRIAIASWIVDASRARGITGAFAIVPNGVDPQRFSAPPRAKGAIPRALMVFSTPRFKGCDLGFEAFRVARQSRPDLELLLFGMDSPPPGTLPGGVEFVLAPAQADIPGLYASADCFLFPSRCEGFGLPILEAMACRTPVVGAATGAAPDLLPSGGGILVGIEDVAGMADGLLRFAEMPDDEWRERSAAARGVAESCDWKASIDRFEAELRSAIESARV